MSETSATWDGRPLQPTCGCGRHCTMADRCEQCGACPHLPHGTHHPAPAGSHHREEET